MAPESDSSAPLAGGLPTQYVDVDPDETREWIDSLDALVDTSGNYRARYMMLSLLRRAAERNVGVPSLRSTDYINTISPEREPWFPGDEAVEREIRRMIRWNAAIMVHRAQRPGVSVGGHLSTYASSAHAVRSRLQPLLPGQRRHTRATTSTSKATLHPASTPAPSSKVGSPRPDWTLPPGTWPDGRGLVVPPPATDAGLLGVPDGVDGPRPLTALYQARFNRYLQNREIDDTSQQPRLGVPRRRRVRRARNARRHFAGLSRAARQPCVCRQLQPAAPRRSGAGQRQGHSGTRGDLPWCGVERHQGHLGRALGPTASRTSTASLSTDGRNHRRRVSRRYKRRDGAYIREHFFGRDPRLAKLVEHLSDDRDLALHRGGHDYRRCTPRTEAATSKDQPTVILAKTIKGWTWATVRRAQRHPPDEEADVEQL